MRRYHARWVLPITSPPIRDGTVVEHAGRLAYVGPRAGAPPGEDRDLGDAVLLPGLVNAHTHLELTAFRGLLEDLPFAEWIRGLQRAKEAVMTPESFLDAARLGVAEGVRAGVTTYGDCCDSGVSMRAMLEQGVRGIMYQEVFCPSPDPTLVRDRARELEAKVTVLRARETPLVHVGVSPHAPYTVSDPLFAHLAQSRLPMAIHVAESEAEMQLVRDARGPFADGLRARGIPVCPRARTPVELLARSGMLEAQPLLIHCVRTDEADIRSIAHADCPVAHCPVSNGKLGHGVAPVLEMLRAGIRVGLGSDSMASNNRMDLLEEARVAILMQRAVARKHDALSAARMLELATLGGARALGLNHRIGSLEPGKDADLTAFSLSGESAHPAYDPATALLFSLGGTRALFVAVAGAVRVWEGRLLDEDTSLPHRLDAAARALASHTREEKDAVQPVDAAPSPHPAR
ncbi:MAG TPA: amidohydrolase family protein [Gemmatimonadaceae bacterium]|nr:amidohydrolase family protein [Gemmatimonadaceae bacterium]